VANDSAPPRLRCARRPSQNGIDPDLDVVDIGAGKRQFVRFVAFYPEPEKVFATGVTA
jgi:hypothetical protein